MNRQRRGLIKQKWVVVAGVSAVTALAACIPSRMNGRQGSGPAWQPTGTVAQQPTQPPANPYPTPYPTPAAPPPATATTARRPPVVQPKRPVPTATATTPAPTPTTPTVQGCGDVNVGGVAVPLDCFTAKYAKVDGAVRALSRGTLRNTANDPEYVDHRYDKIEGPINHQRAVGTGASFAIASAVDQAMVRSNASASAVSAMHLFARSRQSSLADVLKANLGKSVTTANSWPYNEVNACAWALDPVARRHCKSQATASPDANELMRADATQYPVISAAIELDGTNIDELRDTLARNQDIVVALRVDPTAWGSIVRSPDSEPLIQDYVGGNGVHTVTLAGYAKQDNRWYFLVKNSWGTAWAMDGYAWIEEGTLKKNMLGAYVLQVTTSAGSASTPTSCPTDTVPDSVTKQCAPPCPDKSPRANGVCPAAPGQNGCPPGFVNTTGVCVVAAPDTVGADPKTGVSFVCGKAGCTYTWAKGTLGCQQVACSVSCPSPKYLAAVDPDKKTVTCTE